ncbi:MAG: serine/threonine-protein kinase [Desulfobacterales bacterium]
MSAALITGIAVFLCLFRPEPVDLIEFWAYDRIMEMCGETGHSRQIARIEIADRSIRRSDSSGWIEALLSTVAALLTTGLFFKWTIPFSILAAASQALLLAAGSGLAFVYLRQWQPVGIPLGLLGVLPFLLLSILAVGKRRSLKAGPAVAGRFPQLHGEARFLADQIGPLLYPLASAFEKQSEWPRAQAVYRFIGEMNRPGEAGSFEPENRFYPSRARNGGPVAGDNARILDGDDALGPSPGGIGFLGRYELIRKLGSGAVGHVYLGRDPRINRMTAIKTLRFSEGMSSEELKRMKEKFFREAESAGMLSHPRIVTIYDADEDEGIAFIAMEYLDGATLKTFTRKPNRLSIARVAGIGADIAEALDYAHRQGVIHRDIKPANIMMLRNGTVKITDFGMARMTATRETQTGTVKGTPFYMSPEQFAGARIDGKSDIFSLGTTLYQLFTGALPFRGDTPAKLMNAIMNLPHPDPRAFSAEIPRPLAVVLNRAMEKTPERRYSSAIHMARHLRQIETRIRSAGASARVSPSDPIPC